MIRNGRSWIAVAGLLAISLVAVVVDAAFAGTVRGWLDYPFSGVPAHASVAAEIFAHNLRALAGVLGALIVAQAGWRRPGGPSRTQQIIQRLAELVVAGAVAANIILIGASVGAYGQRMLAAMLPHGPVELAGDALALALYWQGRRRHLAPADIAAGRRHQRRAVGGRRRPGDVRVSAMTTVRTARLDASLGSRRRLHVDPRAARLPHPADHRQHPSAKPQPRQQPPGRAHQPSSITARRTTPAPAPAPRRATVDAARRPPPPAVTDRPVRFAARLDAAAGRRRDRLRDRAGRRDAGVAGRPADAPSPRPALRAV